MQVKLSMVAATVAFVLWGSLPIYWKQFSALNPVEVICHRMVWSLLVTAILVFLKGRTSNLIEAFKHPRNLIALFATALLIGANWFIYLWAVTNHYIVETSLGYFINPLVNIACGFIFFKEIMRRGQLLAIFIAFCAVVYLTICYGKFPWIALTLGLSFAIYAVIHKKTTMPALDALFVETVVLFIPAATYIIWREVNGLGGFFNNGPTISLLLMGTGVVTTIPLLLFGYAAHHLRLSTIGIVQYIAPTLSLLIGLFLYNEEFPAQRFIGFSLIWFAILVYLAEGFWYRKRQEKVIMGN
ncbi:MAG: EamA family transporter RarD [Desulfotalea sp.]